MRLFRMIVLFLLFTNGHANHVIDNYKPIFLPVYTSDGILVIALRVFKMNDAPSFLVVNPNNLETSILPIRTLFPRRISSPHLTQEALRTTRYYQLLNQHTKPPYLLENQGVTHAKPHITGNILTIDLCPSRKTLETEFFNQLSDLSKKYKHPIPITIAISGLWLIEHTAEFQWLRQKEREHQLNITWANHSFSHAYYHDTPYSQNFLLSPDTNMEVEVLLTEQYLLEAGETPSVFFRFPGLVSDKGLIDQLKKYGLIPLGADAWLAKDQAIRPGSIILVHGNHNEHEGIVRLWPSLEKLNFVDLKQAI